jgi:hypothetical protein
VYFVQKSSVLVLVALLCACARDPAPVPVDAVAAANANQPLLVVYRSPTCGCCESWAGRMQGAGFAVEVKDMQDQELGAIKAEAGVPAGLESCHTARVGDYFVEGHVPAEDVKRLLAEKPDARGLAVPGMPQGSPGMEQGGSAEPYDVLLVAKDGSTTVYAHHGD